MARTKNKNTKQLNAYFTYEGFTVGEADPEAQDEIREWSGLFEADRYGALFHLGFSTKGKWLSPPLEYLYGIAEGLIRKISQHPELELERESIRVDLHDEEVGLLKEVLPFAIGMEYVDDVWIRRLWKDLLAVFRREIKAYDGTVARYFSEQNDNINIVGRVYFHLVELKEDEYPFAFMATYSTKPAKSRRAMHTPLKNALKEFDGDEKKLLSLVSTVAKASEKSAFISGLMESGELFSPLKFTAKEAYIFFKEIEIYKEAGIMCRVPDWWRKRSNAVRLSVVVGEKEPSKVGLDAIMDFSPLLKVGDQVIGENELRAFLDMAEGLVRYKGKWVEIDKDKLGEALKAFEKVKGLSEGGALSLGEAMRLELNMEKLLEIPADAVDVSVSNGQWLKAVRGIMDGSSPMERVGTVPTFRAVLRDYQEKGYQWLCQMYKLGFGACLADDMGLGKTVQVIAFLEHLRSGNGGRVLLILPASLIGNWQREIERFAPGMPFQVLHKSDLKGSETIQIRENNFLYITTYGMARRLESLKGERWDCLILDEAQAIKNPGTKQTKAIKEIQAGMRIAMTGTPIENRLGDLWSLFDFLNQGLLGNSKEFSRFAKGLSDNAIGYAKLRRTIQPFILRRLKTDKSIIRDLPEKIEINEYTRLSQKQVALYKKLLKQIEDKLSSAEGIERKGLVLSSIMKFKQICNHPDHYMGREDFKPGLSGKFEQLGEICETIREKRERVIVFTQFREMTEPISDFLKEIFLKEGFVLHGGTPVKRRDEMVKQFNGDKYVPYMVLSLKAGGVGLNLASANHVIHFDRWWNPAVENQATDRAFRIGQTKNVMVHKFISKGTIEEKIDAMIGEKQKLSGDILGASGEKWITEYDNDELMEILSLGGGE